MSISDEERAKLKELIDLDKSEMADAELTSRVKLSLQRKYEYPEWALFFEVPGKRGHRADAIAYNLYPSRNFKTVGFEIKVSRSDWKKELENGGKADYFVGQCDEWYVVAGRKGIVKEQELPEGWGLLEMKGGGKLYTIVESEPTEHQDRPLDKEFYMRVVQKALKREKKAKRRKQSARNQGYRDGLEDGKKRAASTDLTAEQKRLMEDGKKIEYLKDHGIHIWKNDPDRLARLKKAIGLVRRIENDGGFGTIRSAVDTLREEADTIEETLTDLRSEVDTE